MAKKIELLHTTYDESGNIESQEVVHPLTSPNCIIMENGKTLDEVMGDGIATPTLTHEGTSFKVGVGDSNIEVVDGDVAGMTLKGQSYQNILPKPTTLIMETDEKEFKINDKIDSNIIIDDNIAEIATVKGKTIVNAVQEESGSEYTVLGKDLSGQSITHVKGNTLEGQTLVNLAPRYEGKKTIMYSCDGTNHTQEFNDTNYKITANNANCNVALRLYANGAWQTTQPLKLNTTYLAIVDLDVQFSKNIYIGYGETSYDGAYGKTNLTMGRQKAKLKFTTPSEINKQLAIGTSLYRTAGEYTTFYSLVIVEYQEGMENWDIPYFEGTKTFESNIKGVTLQGQTLVNAIQEPCKNDYVVLGADDGIEISAETGGHGTIEDTVQGGLNGAVLEGQTLVNIANKRLQNKENTATNGGTSTNYGLLLDGIGYEIAYPLIANKEYLIIEEWNIKSSNDIFHTAQPKIIYEDDTVSYLSSGGNITTLGVHKLARKFIPEKNVKNFYFGLTNKAGNTVSLALNYAMIVEYREGMENWDIPYFEGMKSVQMPVLKTVGKNLFDYTHWYSLIYPLFDYEIVGDKISTTIPVGWWFLETNQIDFSELKMNTVYTMSGSPVNSEITILFWKPDGAFIFERGVRNTPITFRTPNEPFNVSMRFCRRLDSDNTVEVQASCENIQIEEGSTATSYEPYQSSTVSINDYTLNSSQFEQGTFSESSPTGTPYRQTLPTGYMDIRLRSKSLFKVSGNTIRGTLNAGYGIFFGFFKDGKYLAKYSSWMDSTNFSVDVPYECNEFCIVLRKNISDTINVSEYDLIGLTLEQVVELRRIGDVKDELDLTTGRLTQRIGEVVLDGNKEWSSNALLNNGIMVYMCQSYTNGKIVTDNVVSSTLPFYNLDYLKGLATLDGLTDAFITTITSTGKINLAFKKPFSDLNQLKQYLSQNPITVQYELATPIVKTIDLTVTDQDGNTIPHIQTQPTVTHITASSDYLIPTVTINGNLAYDTIIKPSTLYTVRFKHDNVNTDNPLTIDLGGTTQTVTSTEFTITTPSTLTHNQLVFSGKNNVVSEVQVIEGDVAGTQYPFFEGMNDVRITDTNRNVNLFDIKDTVSGFLNLNGGIDSPDFGNLTSNYIKVKPNTTYVYNHGGFVTNFAEYWTAIKFYKDNKGNTSTALQDTTGTTLDKNGKAYYISRGRYTVTGQTGYNTFQFTTPSDCEYIRIGSRGLSYDGAWVTLYQLDNFDDSKFIGRGKNLLHVSKSYLTTNNYNGLTVTRDETKQTITINGTCTTDNTSFGLAPFNMLMEEGKRYILSAELISGTSDKIVFRVNTSDWSSNISCFCESSNNYKNSTAMTFGRDRLYDVSSCRVDSGATFTNATYRVMLEEKSEGNATSYEPYKCVEVQQNVDSIPLTSDMFTSGIFTVSSIISGMSLQQIPTSANGVRMYSKLIKVKPNTTYSCMNFGSTFGLWYLEFDKHGSYFGERKYKQNNVFQTTHNTEYVSVCLYYIDESAITPSTLDSMNLILQEVPQEIVLRGIGDVKDELDLTRGEYIQRIKEFVLNGSEYWIECTDQHGENTMLFQYRGIGCSTISNYTTDGFMCSQLKSVVAAQQWTNNEQCISLNITNAIGIRVSKTNATNKNEFLSWLQKEPITIQCRLNVPIIHKVNLTNTKVIQSYSTETHYETITPSDSLIPNITIPSTLNYDVAIKPSTEYTIRANTSDNLTVDLGGVTGTLSNGKVTLTTPATLTHNEVKFSGTGKVKELMVVEGNEIKDNVPFFNGMKDVQMGGIKLVNVCRGMYTWNTGFITLNTNYNQITFTDKGSYGNIQFDETLLKSHTTYTVYFNITENTSTITSPIGVTLSQTNGKETSTYPIISAKQTGIMSFTITTDEVAKTPRFVVKSGSTDSKITIKNIMIIEGDWTHLDEIPFIESEMIIEQPIIRSQGKNLLDPTTIQTQSYNGNTVTKIPRGFNIKTSEQSKGWNDNVLFYIDVEPYTEYTYSFLKNVITDPYANKIEQGGTVQWREGYCFIKGVQTNDVRMEGSSPNGVRKYFQFNSGNNTKLYIYHNAITDTGCGVGEYELLDFQLEKGHSSSTPYEPYKHQTLYSNRVIGYEDGCYYTWDTGTKASAESIASVMSDVEGLNVAYVTHASSNFSFYDKDGVYLSGSMFLSTATDFDRFGFIKIPANAKYMKMACGNANSTAAKDYHLKATVTGDLPLRSLPNGVCDTLNLVTGEYVQRVGEIVLDGSEKWTSYKKDNFTNVYGAYVSVANNTKPHMLEINNDTLPSRIGSTVAYYDEEGVYCRNDLLENGALYVKINQEKLETQDLDGFKQYLSQNPITVQYELATPIVRKLGFTAKGNYREQVLDGREEWIWNQEGALKTTERFSLATITDRVCGVDNLWCNTIETTNTYNFDAEGLIGSSASSTIYLRIKKDKCDGSWDGFVQWLSQNPTKISYLTNQQSSESYSNIHKPIFFNNVNVQFLPQNLDIQPQLTLQARTRNSYVMDMMKPNTQYSIKLLSFSGGMLIDGKHYALENNRFVSPSTLTNKELIITSQWYEPMIIEGDVTGKNLPYFKGILSSYHDVNRVEVLSQTKNLFNYKLHKSMEFDGTNFVMLDAVWEKNNVEYKLKPNTKYTLRLKTNDKSSWIHIGIDGTNTSTDIGGFADGWTKTFTTNSTGKVKIGIHANTDSNVGHTLSEIQLEEGTVSTPYQPHKENTTLIEMPTRLETVKVVRPELENGSINFGTGANYDDGDSLVKNVRTKDYLPVQPGEIIKFYNNGQGRAVNMNYYDINKQFVKYEFYDGISTRPTVPKDCYFVRMYCGKSACSDITLTRQAWKPIQLNSLPNGVCDEIIMKPNSNKAQLVQRVGKVVLDGSEDWLEGGWNFNDIIEMEMVLSNSVGFNNNMMCESIKVDTFNNLWQQGNQDAKRKESITIFDTNKRLIVALNSNKFGSNNINNKKAYLRQNPLTVYYELATPIIHEIQLKGYPHVYENGTVTFNTDTPHQTLVSYNVNQEQLISTQNETIMRHDQQIDDLYYYIEMYLEEIYQMELFRMKLELSL